MTVVVIFVSCLKWLFMLNLFKVLKFILRLTCTGLKCTVLDFDDDENKYMIRQVVFL